MVAIDDYTLCPTIAPFFGYLGIAFSIVLANVGAAMGTAKAGVGILNSSIASPELIWRNLIPVVMAGVNGIYGLITSIILNGAVSPPGGDGLSIYSLHNGFAHLAAGLCCGLCALGSGLAIGLVGDQAVTSIGYYDYEQKKMAGFGRRSGAGAKSGGTKKGKAGGDNLFVAMVLIQVFAGNIALYGLITSILLSQTVYYCSYN
jgi:V-type H+-transporting ATPase proteolipid subunit